MAEQNPKVNTKPEWIAYAKDFGEKAGLPTMITGKTGEKAVAFYLQEQGLSLREDYVEPTRGYDNFDINISRDIIDVKTCSRKFHDRVLVDKRGFDRGKQPTFYVAVKLSEDLKSAEICGYVPKDYVKTAEVRKVGGERLVYVIYLKDLRPISELVDYYKRVQGV